MSDTPNLDRRHIVTLQGKDYPTYPGALDCAHQVGITALTVELVQVPSDDNGNTAICRATVVLSTGAVFADIGDASPRNTNSKIQTALLRMASTRAKGRALRDAINAGECLAEELSEDDQGCLPPPPKPWGQSKSASPDPTKWGAAPPVKTGLAFEDDLPKETLCVECGLPMKQGQVAFCLAKNLPVSHAECRTKGYSQ